MSRGHASTAAAFLLGAVALLASCRSTPYSVDRANAAEHIALARTDLDEGRIDTAFGRLQAVWVVPNLQPEVRADAELLLAETAPRVSSADADTLIDLAGLDLPRRVRIEIWVAGARGLLEEGERVECFRELQELEETYPLHPRGLEAAELLSRAGLSLAHDDGHYLLLFPYRSKAPAVLEYLVVTYPSSPLCAEAYATLAELYENGGNWGLAIERHQDLLEYHLGSPYAVESELRIPYLRLVRVNHPEYDRNQLVKCREELSTWRSRHAEHVLDPWAQELQHDCLSRLIEHDLAQARFYEKIENPFGARRAADRAREAAVALGDDERLAAIDALLARLPAAAENLDPNRMEGPDLDAPLDSGVGAASAPEEGN